jgi:hypothetical protein
MWWAFSFNGIVWKRLKGVDAAMPLPVHSH